MTTLPHCYRLLLAAIGLCGAQPALACSYSQVPEPVGHASAEFFAARMTGEASFIDVAVAETTGGAFGAPRGWPVPETRFRVVFRIKGESADRFSLYVGELPAGEAAPTAEHFVDEQGRVSPYPYPHETRLTAPQIASSCDPGMLRVRLGQAYLIFREADGRLLGAVPTHDGRQADAFPIMPVAFDESAGWLDAVMPAVGREAEQGAPKKAKTPTSAVAAVRFSPALGADQALSWVQRSGVRAVAVWVARGRLIEEFRLPVGRADSGLIAHAVAGRPRTGERRLAALAATMLDQSDEALELNNLLQLRANLLIDSAAAEPPANAPTAVVAMELTGAPEALRRLGSSRQVAETAAGITVRGRASTEPLVRGVAPLYPHRYEWKQETGRSLRARLQALAENRPVPAPLFRPPEPVVDPFSHTGCIRIGQVEAVALGAPLLARFRDFTLYASPATADCTQSAEALTCRLASGSAVRLDVGGRIGGFRVGPQPASLVLREGAIRCGRS